MQVQKIYREPLQWAPTRKINMSKKIKYFLIKMSDELYSIFVVNKDVLSRSANAHFYKKIFDVYLSRRGPLQWFPIFFALAYTKLTIK